MLSELPAPELNATYSTCAEFERAVKESTAGSGYFVHVRKRTNRSCRMVCSRYKRVSYGQPGLGCPYEIVASLLPIDESAPNAGSSGTNSANQQDSMDTDAALHDPSMVWKITKCGNVHNQACIEKNAQKVSVDVERHAGSHECQTVWLGHAVRPRPDCIQM